MNFSDASSTRALRLFQCFAKEARPLSLSEISKQMDTPLSTCHALIGVLRQGGYLYTHHESKKFYPTKRLLQVAQGIAANDPLASIFEPYLRKLSEATRETVILGTLQQDSVVYLDVIEGPQVIRYTAGPGDIKPLHSSAIGKLILGEMDPGERAKVIKRLALEKVTENTVIDRAALDAAVSASHDAGYYTTRGENVSDVMAIAMPIIVQEEPLGVAVAGPLERVNACFDAIVQELSALKSDLSKVFD